MAQGGGPADKVVAVAVAVLQRPDGAVLLAKRPKGKVYAGFWEFPGGKVEPGETVREALDREIHEELKLGIARADPWIQRTFVYPHARVCLHFFRVTHWSGEPQAIEHEGLAWQQPDSVQVEPMLPANGPVLAGLALPPEYAISQAFELGSEEFIRRLRRRLDDGLRMVQLREPRLSRDEMEPLAARVTALAHQAGARVLINGDVELARRSGADGVHLAARQVKTLAGRPDLRLVGASCHDETELRAAEALGADFAVLGPVRPTPTHPGSRVLGWDGFGRIVRGTAIPVYALGGVMRSDMDGACAHGAHGIAMIRGSWG